MHSAPLTIGIEEEYQLIDPETGALAAVVQQLLHDESIRQIGDQVKPEFMQSQIEIGSAICQNVQEARAELVRLRGEVNSVAERHGYCILAASTHPFAKWEEQEANPGERYEDLMDYMQEVARQMLIFGMHVHVGFGTSRRQLDLLIDIQNQLRYFLPHLLSFSTSSPFWHGHPTGLKSYRSIIFENLPRTGTAPIFSSFSEYERLIETFGQVGTLGKGRRDGKADYTKIWWDSRPHEDFGTLEIRICDICTTVDEAVTIAALVQAIVAKLIKLRNQNLSWGFIPTSSSPKTNGGPCAGGWMVNSSIMAYANRCQRVRWRSNCSSWSMMSSMSLARAMRSITCIRSWRRAPARIVSWRFTMTAWLMALQEMKR